MKQGFIKLFRELEDSPAFQNPELFRFLVWLMWRAAHQKTWVSIRVCGKLTELELQPGQMLFGRNSAAEKLNMAPSTVRNYLGKLRRMHIVNVSSTRHYSIVTIPQLVDTKKNKKSKGLQKDYNRTTIGLQWDTKKNEKNENKKGYLGKKKKKAVTNYPSLKDEPKKTTPEHPKKEETTKEKIERYSPSILMDDIEKMMDEKKKDETKEEKAKPEKKNTYNGGGIKSVYGDNYPTRIEIPKRKRFD